MGGEYRDWQRALIGRFSGREKLSKEMLYERYFNDLPRTDVLECLEFIEEEYSLPSGLLRPDDNLDNLFAPVSTRNPWRWLVYQTRAEDRKSEINYQLGKRQELYGTRLQWVRHGINTIADLIHAWCGQAPSRDKE